jgi:ABC-type sugar transport system ATPase subunit
MIYVALDQVEAMTLADSMVEINLRRAVLFDPGTGKALQGTPR